MPEPCKFPSLDSCQKRFVWTHKEVDLALYAVGGLVLQAGDTENKEVDLALYAVDGLVLQVGDTENFPHALGFESLHSYKGGWM